MCAIPTVTSLVPLATSRSSHAVGSGSASGWCGAGGLLPSPSSRYCGGCRGGLLSGGALSGKAVLCAAAWASLIFWQCGRPWSPQWVLDLPSPPMRAGGRTGRWQPRNSFIPSRGIPTATWHRRNRSSTWSRVDLLRTLRHPSKEEEEEEDRYIDI